MSEVRASSNNQKSTSGAQSFLEKQLPFLAKIISKLNKKKATAEESIEEVTDVSEIDINESTKPEIKKPLTSVSDDKTGDISVTPQELNESHKPYFADLGEEEPPKKKFKIKVWHALVILIGLGVFLLDTDDKSTDQTVPEVAVPQGKSRIKKMVEEVGTADKKDVINADPLPVDSTATTETKNEVEPALEGSPESTTTTTENTSPTETTSEIKLETEEIKEGDNTTTTDEPSIATEVEVSESQETPSTEVTPTISPESSETPSVDSPEIEMVGESENSNVDEQGEVKVENSDDITSDILENLEKKVTEESQVEEKNIEYVSPPDYENFGRGLVYNCQGKHWACIDAASFAICKKNEAANKAQNKKTECHPAEVYNSNDDCVQMQRANIHSLASTSFCN